jgi:ribonucleotide reductase alpha subunit
LSTNVHQNGYKRHHDKLISVCRVITKNLDKVIDRNYYPTEKTRLSNMRHRPMGIGVQGLADVYNMLGFSFACPQAYDLNKRIFETIYYACVDESKNLAKKYGKYSTFDGSPFSQGLLQFHLWGLTEDNLLMGYDWKTLIDEVKTYGTRNSLLTALMPTASTSQIMGNSECIEPYMSNIFKRSTLAGEFIVVNKNLMNDLLKLDLWNDDMRKRLIIENGSVQNIKQIPNNIKSTYKTAFEIGQMHLVRQSADRGIFIDHSQSFNVFMSNPDFDILTAILMDGHDLGNKTGIYYYRTLAAINPISFGIDVDDIKRLTGKSSSRDMITGGYNIDNIDNINNSYLSNDNMKNIHVTKKNKLIVESEQQLNSVKPGYCKWKPGMKLEDCLSCGA